MKKGQNAKRSNKGLVLPLAMVISIILLVIGVGLLYMAFQGRLMAVTASSAIQARTAADAGITHALKQMNDKFVFGGSWDNSWIPYTSPEVSLSNSNAGYTYTITGPVDELWEVISTGTSGRETRIVKALVRHTNLFDYALIVTDKIVLKSGITIDGYDSDIGYDPDAPSEYLKIGTTSKLDDMIVLNNGSLVEGDVLVGVGGEVDTVIKDLGGVTGPRYSMMGDFEFDPIIVPLCTFSGAIDTNNITIGSPGTTNYLEYSSLTLGQSGRMDVRGVVHMHITGDIVLQNSSEIRVMPNSSLTIYSDGDIRAGNSNGINNLTEIPANFILFGTGLVVQKWEIQNGGDFFGVYYAPNADITIKAKADIYGSVSGKSFDLREGGDLHYDISLSDLSQYDTGFAIERWWEL